MQCPLVGMDPYREACDRGEEFHGKLIRGTERLWAQPAANGYDVLPGEPAYIVLAAGKTARRERLRQLILP